MTTVSCCDILSQFKVLDKGEIELSSDIFLDLLGNKETDIVSYQTNDYESKYIDIIQTGIFDEVYFNDERVFLKFIPKFAMSFVNLTIKNEKPLKCYTIKNSVRATILNKPFIEDKILFKNGYYKRIEDKVKK